MRKVVHNESGFTLIEMLIAIAILGIGIAALVDLLPTSIDEMRRAHELTVTSETAASVLSQIQSMSGQALYNDQVPARLLEVQHEADLITKMSERGYTAADIDQVFSQLSLLEQTAALYGYQASVQRLSGDEGVHLQRITVSINSGQGRSQSYTTYVSHR